MILHHEITGTDGAPVLPLGGSPAPPGPYEIADLGRDVLALMDALGIARACYCGVSIGGMVGMWLGANAPDHVERLVLICTAAHLPPASAWRERTASVLEARSPEVVADSAVERWMTPDSAAKQGDVQAMLRAMLRCQRRGRLRGVLRCHRAHGPARAAPEHRRADADRLRLRRPRHTDREPASHRRGDPRARMRSWDQHTWRRSNSPKRSNA